MEPHAAAQAPDRILPVVLRALREHGLAAEIVRKDARRGQARVDAHVRVRQGREEITYATEVKRWLTRAHLGAVVAQLRALPQPAMLVADYLAAPVAEQLKALNVAFADAAGNAYLRGKTFLVWVNGRRAAERQRMPKARRAYRPTGLKLLFALLCNPQWIELNYRELAARAGVAHGTVGWVMRDLADDGFVLETGTKRARARRLRNRRVLLDRWVEAYLRTLWPQTLIGRYQADELDWWQTLDGRKYGALLGGEPAAAVLTEHLKPGIVTLYLEGTPGKLIAEHRLRGAADGNVELRRRFWAFDYPGKRPGLAPPLLVYADLLGTGDARCIDAARRVFDGELARLVAED